MENYFFYVKIFDCNYLHLTAQTKETYFSATSFYEMHHVRHLRPNLQKTQKKIFGKKVLNVTTVMIFSNKKFNILWVF